MIYEFRITLLDVGVPVWRDIQIDDGSSFSDLHFAIQAAFNWLDFQLHQFELIVSEGKKIAPILLESLDDEDEHFEPDEAEIEEYHPLRDYFQKQGDTAVYTYNFEEKWEHEIVLTKIVAPAEDTVYPICTGAENLAPEEEHTRKAIRKKKIKLAYENSEEIVASINLEFAFLTNTDFEDTNLEFNEEYGIDDSWDDGMPF
ncbi:plasmid pria4b orf3 [Trichococcus palustris]|uniref:Plasmid pria4b orf3 n=1 Tax=Trichococcus palustris TaxID=140314 RepID=A0A143Z042_9LACT|nr:plasmid pRiA4b ORF-3 family protein [Trichococcus palustris]CZR01446.1 plasmid pria4b orf3 [Trichococcus palustris]SFL06934.1 pRiA4b ORF-3-like protein [Trichococcus palustris]